VDIVIGTHRLISKDVSYKNLGVAIVDEEQRFGVKHKERFKEMFHNIDMLTLSATPIPRTLYLSLMGARDMTTIDTPIPGKVPINTSIHGYDERIIRDAIQREIKRGGQVFFLHNRVKSIDLVRKKLKDLVPEASIVVGHGQMEKDELEVVMRTFVQGNADILLATTIIESGIDIPNANTIIIDRADRFGLADLYQLRGRVGRAGGQAYALLLLPRDLIQGDARKRINAIKQYTALGSGFKIAMRDLEIRGAGNLLGTKQSGHISAVGFDLYCQLLRQSIDRLKGGKPAQRVDVTLRTDILTFNEGEFAQETSSTTLPAYLPTSYMPEARLRISAYKELAELVSQKELKALRTRWIDRFGKPPISVKNLLTATSLKLAAARAGISTIEIREQKLMLTRNGEYIFLGNKRHPRLTETKPSSKLNEALKMIESI
jgi:transcription-repair coupling factor (superfamily II helicase)